MALAVKKKKKKSKKVQSENMAFNLEVAFSVEKKIKMSGGVIASISARLYLHSYHVCLSKCLSVSLHAHVHGCA